VGTALPSCPRLLGSTGAEPAFSRGRWLAQAGVCGGETKLVIPNPSGWVTASEQREINLPRLGAEWTVTGHYP